MSKEADIPLLLQQLQDGFSRKNEVTTLELATDINHDRILAAVRSLMTRLYVNLQECKQKRYSLTKEGAEYVRNGSPEYNLLQFILKHNEPVEMAVALKQVRNADKGLRKLLKESVLSIDAKKSLSVSPSTQSGFLKLDVTKQLLDTLTNESTMNFKERDAGLAEIITNPNVLEAEVEDLRKRKLIDCKILVYYVVTKGEKFSLQVKPLATDLTQEMIEKGTWRDVEFKEYNFFSSGKSVPTGTLHPLVRTSDEFREIFLSMGFEEMEDRHFVESSFWCFDSLYIPQQHPARDAQDTFFTREPANAHLEKMDQKYIDAVAQAHGDGSCYGSTGWQYEWQRDEAAKLVLRTHTTSLSARLLKCMAANFDEIKDTLPRYFFNIGKVFRNESTDATHLSEFHQVEGLIVGVDIGLSHLIGVLSTFYEAIGIAPLKFKPTYNPYTEPSMEIYGFHSKLKTWVEIGNSGIFRPEMLLPMGLPPHVKVIAWGLSLERPTMIRDDIRDIRDLVGCNYVDDVTPQFQ